MIGDGHGSICGDGGGGCDIDDRGGRPVCRGFAGVAASLTNSGVILGLQLYST